MEDDYGAARENMVKTQLVQRGIRDSRVLKAMRDVPRERFVPESMKLLSYDDSALAIGKGQTISQPYIVALMTEAMELNGDEKTLEIGTGSGYQAAILAELSRAVYSVERIQPLLKSAKKILDELGYINIYFKASDGTLGWSENAPFDAIIVTAGAPSIPMPLMDQLNDGGRLVVPVGNRFTQELIRISKRGKDLFKENLGGVRFVSLIGEYGWSN
jgi:protein-L-isoaspartate(D-aspartate) O-methyltransferase